MAVPLQSSGAARPSAAGGTELSPELQELIERESQRAGKVDHFAILDLPWNASADDARRAYLEKVKVFHPDRHAGRQLGPWLAKLEKVFRALTAAREELADEARRAAYAHKTAPPEQWAREEARRLTDAARSEERRARLRRANPIVARAARVQELFERGRAALAAGKFSQAANDLLTVVGLDPRHPEARALAEEARKRASGARARELYEKGLQAEAVGQPATALELLREALEISPGDPRCAVAASRLALTGGDSEGARSLAAAAVASVPRDARAQSALGAALHALGDTRGARKALEDALAIDPELAEAKTLQKKLRWSFLG